MATQAAAAVQLAEASGKLDKIGTETAALLVEVQALKDAAGNAGEVTPELQSAIDAVSAQAQKVDDLVPDAAPPPEPVP